MGADDLDEADYACDPCSDAGEAWTCARTLAEDETAWCDGPNSKQGADRAYSFDVALVPAGLPVNGRRDITRPVWRRVVVAADGLVAAHLTAALLVGVHGMVIEVLYRD